MSVGQVLAAARSDKGLTIEALSAATRIRGTLLRAIEADDFSMCGGDVYARGHIRSIARVVDIDPEPLLTEFDIEHPRESIDHTLESIGDDYRPITRDRRNRPAWGAAMLVAVLVIISGIALAGILNPKPKGAGAAAITTSAVATTTPATGASTAPTVPSSTVAPPTTTAPAAVTTDPVAQAPRDGVNLRLRVTGRQCWISVTDSTGKQVQATLHTGDVRDFKDPHELSLIIGDAGALTIINNGVELPPLGKAGAVVRRTFTVATATAGSG